MKHSLSQKMRANGSPHIFRFLCSHCEFFQFTVKRHKATMFFLALVFYIIVLHGFEISCTTQPTLTRLPNLFGNIGRHFKSSYERSTLQSQLYTKNVTHFIGSNEESFATLKGKVSQRTGRFLGRLAFLVGLGNGGLTNMLSTGVSSYIRAPQNSAPSRWSPYLAAIYEPFPFYSQPLAPSELIPFSGTTIESSIADLVENDGHNYPVYRDMNHSNKTVGTKDMIDDTNKKKQKSTNDINNYFKDGEQHGETIENDVELLSKRTHRQNSTFNDVNEQFLFGNSDDKKTTEHAIIDMQSSSETYEPSMTHESTATHKHSTTTYRPVTHYPSTTHRATTYRPSSTHRSTTHRTSTTRKPTTHRSTTIVHPTTEASSTTHSHSTSHNHISSPIPTTASIYTTIHTPTVEISEAEELPTILTKRPEITTIGKPVSTSERPTTKTTVEVTTAKPVSTTPVHSAFTKTTVPSVSSENVTSSSNATEESTISSDFHGYYGGYPQHIEHLFLTTQSNYQDYNELSHEQYVDEGHTETFDNDYDHFNVGEAEFYEPLQTSFLNSDSEPFQRYFEQSDFIPLNVDFNNLRHIFVS